MALIDKAQQIQDNSSEILAQTSALLAYANGITGASDTRLGDAVRTLGDGYGQGGDGFAVHEVDFTLSANEYYYNVLGQYAEDYAWFYYYPTEATNTQIQTICVGYKSIAELPTTPAGVKLLSPNQYYVNDASYNSIRMRGNVNRIPAGTYKLVWFGTAK